MMEHKIFLLEDDYNFGQVLQSYLEMNDYQVVLINDGQEAFKSYLKSDYDICILDVMLPNVDGFTIAKKIREIHPKIPLIFLTAKTLKADILEGFKIGADDYITKPFDSEVLLYKIKAIIKRNEGSKNINDSKVYTIGKYTFKYEQRLLITEQSEKKLSPKENELLHLLCKKTERFTKKERSSN